MYSRTTAHESKLGWLNGQNHGVFHPHSDLISFTFLTSSFTSLHFIPQHHPPIGEYSTFSSSWIYNKRSITLQCPCESLLISPHLTMTGIKSADLAGTQSQRDRTLSRRYIEGLIADGKHVFIFDDRVLKVDAWIKFHPGGDKAIKHMVGRDATDEVNACVP